MFPPRGSRFLITVYCLTILLKSDYLFVPVEAMNGVIWRKNASDFAQISSIQALEKINEQRILNSREIETHDFNGTKLKFTGIPIQNLVNFISNDTVVTGVHGDVWQILSEMLNFKIHSEKLDGQQYGTRSKNGSWDGLLGYIYRNETDIVPRCATILLRLTALDFTFATGRTSYRFYIKKQPEYYRTWMTDLFSRGLWLSVIGLFFTLTFASYTLRVFNFSEEQPIDSISNLGDHFFYIFSIFCNQGWTPHQLEKRSKILMITTRMFAWLIVIAFSSTLMSQTAQGKFQPPFNDLKSFYRDTDYTLIVRKNSVAYSAFQTFRDPIYKMIIDAGRLIQADNLEALQKICTGKFVYLGTQDVVEAEDFGLCEMSVVGKPFLNTWVAEGLVRGFKYKKTIDLGLLKLLEFGIIHRLRSKWLKKTAVIKTSSTFESLGLEHVFPIFSMLASAIVLSLVILLIENIVT